MNKFTKTLACAGLVAVLGTTSLAGCGKSLDGTKIAATCGDDKITLGTANMMLRMTQAQMASYYSMFGGSAAGIWDQDGEDGKTYGENTKDDMMDQIHNMVLLKQHAKDYDVSITEDEQKKIEEAAKKFMEDNDADTIAKLAVSQSDIETILEFYTYQEKMYDPMTADVDTNVEDSEAAQSKITICQISTAGTQDAEGKTVDLTDEEKQAKKDQAQAVLDKIKAQEDPAAADMDALAKEVDENLSASVKTFGSDDTSLDDKLKEAVKSLTDGQVAPEVIEGEDAYYVARMDSVFDEDATKSKKESIVSERKQEAYKNLLEEWGKDTKIEVDKKVWKKVTLTDSDAYTFKQPETQGTDNGSSDTGDTGTGDTGAADNGDAETGDTGAADTGDAGTGDTGAADTGNAETGDTGAADTGNTGEANAE